MTTTITAEELVARTMTLLSRAATRGVCRGRVRELIGHLECVAGDQNLDASIRSVSKDLLVQWQDIQSEEFGAAPVKH